MNSIIEVKNYREELLPFSEKEILRYAGCKAADEKMTDLVNSCIDEIKGKLTYKLCYRLFPVDIKGEICDFGAFSLRSESLQKNLSGCKEAYVFAATVGINIDRSIAKYGRISPSRALFFQALGAERIEALCDRFCDDLIKEKNISLKPRFSPGYGDLPLLSQRDIFRVLECEKHIGLYLNESLLMSPSKSVTAIVGVSDDEGEKK